MDTNLASLRETDVSSDRVKNDLVVLPGQSSPEKSTAGRLIDRIWYFFLVYLMVGYVFIVSSALEPWSCKQDLDGRMHMKAEPSIECQWCHSESNPNSKHDDSDMPSIIRWLNHLEYRNCESLCYSCSATPLNNWFADMIFLQMLL
jgi:hypothetical protein